LDLCRFIARREPYSCNQKAATITTIWQQTAGYYVSAAPTL
jgi:hypothetical protein